MDSLLSLRRTRRAAAAWAPVLLLVAWTTLAGLQSDLPTGSSTRFSGSGTCVLCHAPGSTNPAALRDASGADVSPPTRWRSTMMANAARDPYWQAKVTAEVAAHPELQTIIEDKCTTCHAPLGRTEAVLEGSAGYTLAEARADPLAMDGVSCTLCHQLDPAAFGSPESFSGAYEVEEERVLYGPYPNPLVGPMQMFTGFSPAYGPHMREAGLCATCHTLFTPYLDNAGAVAGEFPEQTPFLEWKNSVYPARETPCQSCHVPQIQDEVVVTTIPPGSPAYAPYGLHHFVGGNAFMLRLLRRFSAELGVTAETAHFDSTLARTLRQLRHRTATLEASSGWLNEDPRNDPDTLFLEITVRNRAGHKFPTGFPSRRAWLRVTVAEDDGEAVFDSGAWDPETGEITALDQPYEPHHDLIRTAGQVQVYEAVPGDVDGKATTTLLRMAQLLKDNRLPPEGFTASGEAYEVTAVAGRAAEDDDFNRADAREGTGADVVRYAIGGLDRDDDYTVTARLLYQSLKPGFVDDLRHYDTPEVESFLGYYGEVPNTPVTVDSVALRVAATTAVDPGRTAPDPDAFTLDAYPNPFGDRLSVEVRAARAGFVTAEVFDLLGRRVYATGSRPAGAGVQTFVWRDDVAAPGAYVVRVVLRDADGRFRAVQNRVVRKGR